MVRDLELSRADNKWVREHVDAAARRLPLTWTEMKPADFGFELRQMGVEIIDDGTPQRGFRHTTNGLRVIVTGAYHEGKRWLHVSASKSTSTPSWGEMWEVKRVFVGEDRRAIMVSPPKEFYVNVHKFTLHWWACWDDDGLPEFSRGLGMV